MAKKRRRSAPVSKQQKDVSPEVERTATCDEDDSSPEELDPLPPPPRVDKSALRKSVRAQLDDVPLSPNAQIEAGTAENIGRALELLRSQGYQVEPLRQDVPQGSYCRSDGDVL